MKPSSKVFLLFNIEVPFFIDSYNFHQLELLVDKIIYYHQMSCPGVVQNVLCNQIDAFLLQKLGCVGRL